MTSNHLMNGSQISPFPVSILSQLVCPPWALLMFAMSLVDACLCA